MKVTITNDWFSDDGYARPYLEVGRTYDLNELVHHENEYVRWTVAKQGYGLDKLINDKKWMVREAVENYLEEHNYKSVFDWAKDNGVDIDIDEWLNSDEWTKRKQVAKYGYGLDKLVNDKYWSVREAVAKQGYGLDILINDIDPDARAAVAEHGYGLDILINDRFPEVRSAVTKQGYCLDVLINDKDWHVRSAVAEQGYGLDVLINDKDWHVRHELAWQGYCLDVLVNDKDSMVRWAVAKQGYGLNKLINDTNCDVSCAASNYLKEHGYKSINAWARANPDMVYGNINTETTDHLKDFVYRIDDSNSLKAESSYESVEAFFNDNSKESYKSNESLVILSVDTKIPLIKLEKSIKDEKQVYKFIVDITNENDNDFIIRSIITSKDNFNQLLESTINALNEYPQFSKYISDLENCL